MPNLPTYDDDQDGGMRLQMDCRECGNTGIRATGIDPKTKKLIRYRCNCDAAIRRRNRGNRR